MSLNLLAEPSWTVSFNHKQREKSGAIASLTGNLIACSLDAFDKPVTKN